MNSINFKGINKSKKRNNDQNKEIYLKKGKKAKTLIESYRDESKINNVQKNLDFIKKISRPVVDYETIASAVSVRKIEKPNKKVSNESSVFTEEDFKSFEKSYFNR